MDSDDEGLLGPRPRRERPARWTFFLHVAFAVLLLAAVSAVFMPRVRTRTSAHPPTATSDSAQASSSPSPVAKEAPLSTFLPSRLRLLDSRTGGNEPPKFLFRGNGPFLPENASDPESPLRFAYDELVAAMREVAAGNGTEMPPRLYLHVFTLLDPVMEKTGVDLERDFFDEEREKGEMVNWPLIGDVDLPSKLPEAERRRRAAALESWQPDRLVERTATMRSLFLAGVPKFYLIDSEAMEDLPEGAPHAAFVAFFHCNHGQDRTGELAAAYRIRYFNSTAEAELEENMRIGMDVPENINAVWWFGEWKMANATASAV
ncbi:hypothetical protein DFJ74DRAFT_704398 [Hyaloraphidium curvatum]|nr:hypothetical protein DFJ74DRAFT_704398 [Hyaloraphidium curvatum]